MQGFGPRADLLAPRDQGGGQGGGYSGGSSGNGSQGDQGGGGQSQDMGDDIPFD